MQFDDCCSSDVLNCLYYYWEDDIEDLDGCTPEEYYEMSIHTVKPPARSILKSRTRAEICLAYLKALTPCCYHNLEAALELENIILTKGDN